MSSTGRSFWILQEQNSCCQDLQAEQLNMRFELIVLMILLLSWRWDLLIDLYPSAPPDTDQG
jgi:hypothetical protein